MLNYILIYSNHHKNYEYFNFLSLIKMLFIFTIRTLLQRKNTVFLYIVPNGYLLITLIKKTSKLIILFYLFYVLYYILLYTRAFLTIYVIPIQSKLCSKYSRTIKIIPIQINNKTNIIRHTCV